MPHRTKNFELEGIRDHCEICGLYATLTVYRIDEVVCEDCRELLGNEWGRTINEKKRNVHKNHE